jgi:hypothetical protein
VCTAARATCDQVSTTGLQYTCDAAHLALPFVEGPDRSCCVEYLVLYCGGVCFCVCCAAIGPYRA